MVFDFQLQTISINHTKGFRLLFVALLILLSFSAAGQKMSIASFKMDEADQTANVNPTMRTDINGEKCALIKIATTQKNFSFDVGSLGVTAIEWQNSEHPGEIWLYVPNGVMKISIQHPQFGSIKDYDLGGRLKKGRTYVMDLTSDQINTLVVDYENSQILDVDITPHDADLYINGLKQNLDYNGHASITLPFGTHNYRVVANNYHPEESQVAINNKENKHQLYIRLKQAFGYLSFTNNNELSGAEVYLDDKRVGTLPSSPIPVKSGNHKLAVYQKLYSPYTENFTLTDSTTYYSTPVMRPNYAECEIYVDGDRDAQIFDNGELIGSGHWKGKLEAGEHLIEAKKMNHYSSKQKIDIVKDIPRKLSISRPMPIYGSLEISTEPKDVEVYIDRELKPAGKTVYINNQILIGSHHIKLIKAGHKTQEFDVEIKEGETTRINKILEDYCNFMIYCNPRANISIDGKEMGKTPLHFSRMAGDYKVTITEHGYSKYSKKLKLDGNTEDIYIKLHRNYTRPNEFYLQAGYNAGNMTALNFGMGAHAGNINFEGNYLLPLSKCDMIYWTDTSGETVPFTASYTPIVGKFKLGYGIRLHNRIRLTPQVGCQILQLKEKIEEYEETDNYDQWANRYEKAANGANTTSLTFGLRFNVALASCLGVSLTPEYLLNVNKSEGYKALSNVSPTIKKLSEGLNINLNLNLFF